MGQTNFIWDGGHPTQDPWSQAVNWNPNIAPPTSNALSVIIMSGTSQITNTADTAFYIHSLVFTNDAGSFVIYGSALTIASNAGILQNSPNAQLITNIINLGAAQNWTVNSNTLTLSGPINLGANLLTINGSSNLVLNGQVSGSGGLTKAGLGALVLNASNTFTGVITNSAGTIESQNPTGLSTPNIVLNGGTLSITTTNQAINQTITVENASTLNVATGITNSIGNAVDDLTGAGSLVKTGAGVLVLGYGNNLGGGMTLNGGTVIISNNASLGTGLLTLNGGTLYISGNTTISNALAVTSSGTLSADNGDDDTFVSSNISGNAGTTLNVRNLNSGTPPHSLIFTSNGFTYAGNIDLDTTSRLRFDNAAGTNAFTGVISGFGYNSQTILRNIAGGTTILGGANTFTGSVDVTAGTLLIQNGSALGDTTGTTLVRSGADLLLEGGISVGSETMTLNGSGAAGNGALRNVSGNNSWAGPVTLSTATTVGSDAGGLAISGTISGTVPLTKVGTGTLLFSGNNTFTGALTNNAGTLVLGANNALGTAAGNTVIASGASLGFSNNINYSTAEALTISSTGVGGNGVLINLQGTNRFAGPVTMAAASTIASSANILTLQGAITNGGNLLTATASSGSQLIFSNVVSGTGGLTVGGGGSVSLFASNAFTGAMILTNNSTLSLDSSRAVTTNNITFSGGTLTLGTDGITNVFGSMTLTTNSSITLNSGGINGALTFTNINHVDGILTVNNWTGEPSCSGSNDRIYLTTDPGFWITNKVQFIGFNLGAVWNSATGELSPAPEPSSILAGSFLAMIVGLHFFWRLRNKETTASPEKIKSP